MEVENFGCNYGIMTTENYMTIGKATASIFTPKTYSFELGENFPKVYFTEETLGTKNQCKKAKYMK